MSALPLDVQIVPHDNGRSTVVVDGHDVSRHIVAVHVDIEAREQPQVTLDLIPRQVAIALLGADVVLDTETRALLAALGWTPPRGES